jgi:hypothetical protein
VKQEKTQLEPQTADEHIEGQAFADGEPLSPAEVEFRQLQKDPVRWHQWCEEVRRAWFKRNKIKPRGGKSDAAHVTKPRR